MSPTPRRRPSQELSRGRFRTLFFVVVSLAAATLQVWPALAAAAVGAALGLWSISVARTRGRSLGHSFVACDWLLLGLCLALSSGLRSPLLVAVPFLIVIQLLPSPKAEWPYLIGPSLLALIVVAIADPSLAGHKVLGLAGFAVLVSAGAGAALRLRRVPRRSRSAAPAVDPATGFYTKARLARLLAAELEAGAASHQPLTLVCVRLDHFRDLHDFLGEQGSEHVIQTMARRLKRLTGPDDLAFRLAPDTLAFTLAGQDSRAARKWAQEAGHAITAQLIDRQRHTVSIGQASYPPLREGRALLDEALAALAAPGENGRRPELVVTAPSDLPVAVAQ